LEKVTIRVPATTANLGPGFDCLGMALDIYNEVTAERSDAFGISISGKGADILPYGKENRIYHGVAAVFDQLGQPIPRLRLSCKNEIPLARGLGSSAAAIVSGLVAANFICDEPLPREQLLYIADKLEGHADNAAAAIFGGCQIVVRENEGLVRTQISPPENLIAVLFIPDFEMSTEVSRSILPEEVSRDDAVYNIGRTALLVAALLTGEFSHLRVAMQDMLHQPRRQVLFPAMATLFEAALEAGALGVSLSGGGPSILALALQNGEAIGEAMVATAKKEGVNGEMGIVHLSHKGAHMVAKY
jgi:homoserine kinase